MARKKSVDLEQTRLTLLETGLELFEQKGFNATGIQEITDIAGVPKGSFYNYFISKEGFGVDVIRYYTEIHIERWKNLLAAEEGNSYLALSIVFTEIAARYEGANPKKGCLLGTLAAEISEASDDCRVALSEAVRQFKEILAQRLMLGQQTGKVRSDLSKDQLADLVWNCWQGSLLQMKIDNSAEPVKKTLDVLFENILIPCPE
ncbi:MAG: transcriptional regulator [Firmicutes bacterium]|nr:transcriptional regulator [Bacillota bacterium]